MFCFVFFTCLGNLKIAHAILSVCLHLKSSIRTSLVVQWLRLGLPMQGGVCVQSLVGELRSSIVRSQKAKAKQKQCCNKFNRDFKNGPHQKKKKKRKTKELFTDLSTEKMSYRGEGEHWNLMLQKSSHLQTNKGKPHPVDWHYLKG